MKTVRIRASVESCRLVEFWTIKVPDDLTGDELRQYVEDRAFGQDGTAKFEDQEVEDEQGRSILTLESEDYELLWEPK